MKAGALTFRPCVADPRRLVLLLKPAMLDAHDATFSVDLVLVLEVRGPIFVREGDATLSPDEEEEEEEEQEEKQERRE